MKIELAESHIDEALDELKERIPIALEAVGLQAEGYAQLNCPVDTGFLRNSITHAVGGQTAAVAVYQADDVGADGKKRRGAYSGVAGRKGDNSVYIGSNVEYAAPVEFNDGVAHKTGKAHYLRDAITDHADEYGQIVEAYLKG